MAHHNNPMMALTALRDFFVARNAVELKKAYRSLTRAVPQQAPDEGDWEAVEFAFNRLFVGPGPVAAPPYASVYTDDEPFVMGETTLKIRRLYEMIGLRSAWNGTIPDDHIALELEACMVMRQGMTRSDSSRLLALYDYFMSSHVAIWIPKFIDRVTQADEVPDPIFWVCRQLSAWPARHSDPPAPGGNP